MLGAEQAREASFALPFGQMVFKQKVMSVYLPLIGIGTPPETMRKEVDVSIQAS